MYDIYSDIGSFLHVQGKGTRGREYMRVVYNMQRGVAVTMTELHHDSLCVFITVRRYQLHLSLYRARLPESCFRPAETSDSCDCVGSFMVDCLLTIAALATHDVLYAPPPPCSYLEGLWELLSETLQTIDVNCI